MIAEVRWCPMNLFDYLDAAFVSSALGRRTIGKVFVLSNIHFVKPEAEEEGGDGGASIFAGGVEDAVSEGGLLKLLFGLGAGVAFKIRVGGNEDAGGAHVDTRVLVVECGHEKLRGRQGDVDRLAAVLVGDADVFGFELREVDAGDGLAVNDEKNAVSGQQVRENHGGFGAFDDGIDRVDDRFQTGEALNLLDDSRDGGVEGGGAAGDGGCDSGENAGGGVADEDRQGHGSEDEREQNGEEGPRGAAT